MHPFLTDSTHDQEVVVPDDNYPTSGDDRVVVTVRVHPDTRARLRLISAYLSVTQAELVDTWAVEQSTKLGLPDPDQVL